MIEVEHLTKKFGPHTAIDDITFSARQGEILGFLGPNGAGKTTTMRILTCFFPPSSGRAVVAGHDCFEESLAVRKRIGYLPESVPLYRDMGVEHYLRFVAGVKGMGAKEITQGVARVVSDCGLEAVTRRPIGELSKGYRQRVGLAQALVNDPAVLVLDEPTVGLDPRQIREIRKLIKDLAGQRTVIISTHILPEVRMVCDRIVIVNGGRLVAVDTPDNLTAHLRTATRIALRVMGPPQEILQTLRAIPGVKQVEESPPNPLAEGHGFVVELQEGTDAQNHRKVLAPAIIGRHWDLVEMHTLEMSLEEVFIKLVTREEEV
ncbi:MAG: ABC transporter ATP-binding protein [Magnetococcus sp. DMHC-8]